ncbi:SDR family NAD(P)-dependent oxidoreductase [Peribacillus cavernae]|uniref:SDR family NAD(P)-dependent oxidoreductase n=1 Tax=Peribacillus cavernae TaxID=1674310 RepID=A0A433HG25_9BACI|nr:SDR family NAD(P)-dependent oxidoreductase [Peribacillus cavernae]
MNLIDLWETYGFRIKTQGCYCTGGSKGRGYETACQLVREGAKVSICGREKETLKYTASSIYQKTGEKIYAIQADVSKLRIGRG